MDLDRLRESLAELDRELLRTVARRQELSEEIGRAKLAAGLPARDYVQEREVVDRARRHAGKLGLSSEVADRLVSLLIHASLVAQEQLELADRLVDLSERSLALVDQEVAEGKASPIAHTRARVALSSVVVERARLRALQASDVLNL